MTQKQQLLEMLTKKEWVCTTEFQDNYLPEFRSLIAHLRKHEGYTIIDERCMSRCGKNHKSSGLKRWQWVRLNFNGQPLKQNEQNATNNRFAWEN